MYRAKLEIKAIHLMCLILFIIFKNSFIGKWIVVSFPWISAGKLKVSDNTNVQSKFLATKKKKLNTCKAVEKLQAVSLRYHLYK